MDYLDELSRFVVDTKFKDLSDEAVAAVREVTLDTVGAIIAGSKEAENSAFARLVAQRSGSPTSTILGLGLKAEPMLATLVNSTAGVALEMDEGNRFGGGHPAIHTLPGTLAVAEELGSTGKRFIEAVLVGYEVESRMGGATKPRENVHSHGHWGAIGTAASVAKLHECSPAEVRDIINLAASMSPANTWATAFSGATIRNLYPGRSGLHGVLAYHLHTCGFTGLNDAPSDIFNTIIGDSFDKGAVIENLGVEYRIQKNYFKLHACCRFNHPAVDAVLSAALSRNFGVEEVESIHVSVPTMLDGMLGEYPNNMLAAKFNVPYAVAVAVIFGKADTTVFRPRVIADKNVKEMAGRVIVEIDATLIDGQILPKTIASIHLKNGDTLSGETRLVRGDYANPIQRDELERKFDFLTKPILGAERCSLFKSKISNLENIEDVRSLTNILS